MKNVIIIALLSSITSSVLAKSTIFSDYKSTGSIAEFFLDDTDIPSFFTPNGDGLNDTWSITSDTEIDRIFIFDRYGKLLGQISPGIFTGWDGTFAGKTLPSSDYWYSIEFSDGSNKNGHFSLKR